MVYICHRTEAQPRSCGKYRPFFEFLYLSPGTKPSSYNLYSFIYCFSLGFPNFEFSENIGSQLLPYITIQELNFCPIFVTGRNKYNYIGLQELLCPIQDLQDIQEQSQDCSHQWGPSGGSHLGRPGSEEPRPHSSSAVNKIPEGVIVGFQNFATLLHFGTQGG